MAKARISIGSWAYLFNQEVPTSDFHVILHKLQDLGYDGVELGSFGPHPSPVTHPTRASRQKLKKEIADHGLALSGIAVDLWAFKNPGTSILDENPMAYLTAFLGGLAFAADVDAKTIRVDTVIGPNFFETDEGKKIGYQAGTDRLVSAWDKCSKMAADFGLNVCWEFEPGFAFNKPSEIVRVVDAVRAKGNTNFGVLYDTCHAHMVAAVGANQPGEKETLAGGAKELLDKLKGKVTHIHLIDSDGSLNEHNTSTHNPFGTGALNFDDLIPAMQASGVPHDWWTVDLCFWPHAWEVTADSKKFLDKLRAKHAAVRVLTAEGAEGAEEDRMRMSNTCNLTVLLFFLCALRALCGEPSLSSRIEPIAKAHKGKVAVAVKHLGTGEGYALDADTAMPTASLIKLPVMVEAYWQAHEGKVKLDATLTLKKDDKVQGSGILTSHFSDGATFPLRDAVRLMIVYSDNTATNMVLDQVGLPSVNERMEKLGLKDTTINAKVFRPDTRISQERGKKYGLGSTTANDMVRLLERIEAGKVVSADACKQMLGHLKACDDKEKMTRFLPPGTVVAHKTGSVNASKTDAGIIYVPDPADKKKTHPVAVCVLTDGNEDQRWVADNAAQVTIGKIAKEVYDHFAAKK